MSPLQSSEDPVLRWKTSDSELAALRRKRARLIHRCSCFKNCFLQLFGGQNAPELTSCRPAQRTHAPVPPPLPSAPWASARAPGPTDVHSRSEDNRENKHGKHHPPSPQEPADRKHTHTTAEGLKAEGLHHRGSVMPPNGVNQAPGLPATTFTTDGGRLDSMSSVCVRPG